MSSAGLLRYPSAGGTTAGPVEASSLSESASGLGWESKRTSHQVDCAASCWCRRVLRPERGRGGASGFAVVLVHAVFRGLVHAQVDCMIGGFVVIATLARQPLHCEEVRANYRPHTNTRITPFA